MTQRFFIGINAVSEFVSSLHSYTPKHIFVVRGKKSFDLCGASPIIKNIQHLFDCEITEFYDFEENPKIEDLNKGLASLEKTTADFIIGIGGGSVMDMAKLLRFFHSYDGDITKYEFIKVKQLLPLATFPTTAGTGAEATHFAVLYKDKVKYSVEHDDIRPDIAIVYPPFTYGNSKYLTACTGFDALAQAIEAYWSKQATAESDRYAEKAMQSLWENLPLVVNSPYEKIRDIVAESSYWAGRAIDIAKTTAAHALSYPFTSYYGYPHGHAVALLFPYIAAYNLEHISTKTKEIYTLLHKPANIPVVAFFNEYIDAIGLQPRKHSAIDKSVILANVNQNRLKNNPVKLSEDTLLKIIDDSKICCYGE